MGPLCPSCGRLYELTIGELEEPIYCPKMFCCEHCMNLFMLTPAELAEFQTAYGELEAANASQEGPERDGDFEGYDGLAWKEELRRYGSMEEWFQPLDPIQGRRLDRFDHPYRFVEGDDCALARGALAGILAWLEKRWPGEPLQVELADGSGLDLAAPGGTGVLAFAGFASRFSCARAIERTVERARRLGRRWIWLPLGGESETAAVHRIAAEQSLPPSSHAVPSEALRRTLSRLFAVKGLGLGFPYVLAEIDGDGWLRTLECVSSCAYGRGRADK